MTRFVAVSVLPDQARDVRLLATGRFGCQRQTTDRVYRANFCRPPISSIRPLMSCGAKNVYCHEFASVKPNVTSRGSKGSSQLPLLRGRMKPDRRIENVLVRLRPRAVAFVILGLAEHARDLRYAPIVVGILKDFRN